MNDSSDLLSALKSHGIKISEEVSGASLTSFQIGGALRYLVEPDSVQELLTTVASLTDAGAQFRVLGAGSNLLIPDRGIAGWTIRLGRGFRYQKQLSDREFEVGGAMPLMPLSSQLTTIGLSGLEFAGGIPASLGGAVRMNAGAHGGEMAGILTSVTFVTDLQLVTMSPPELAFSYRRTSLPNDAIVVSANLRFTPGDPVRTIAERARCLEYRKRTQPLTLPSAGSVFRNPSQEQPAGRLLEEAGLKGSVYGGAQVSALHANWIVNPERKASAADIVGLIGQCQAKVAGASGIQLEPEIVRW